MIIIHSIADCVNTSFDLLYINQAGGYCPLRIRKLAMVTVSSTQVNSFFQVYAANDVH